MPKQKSKSGAPAEPTSAGSPGGPAGKKQRRKVRRNLKGKGNK